MDIFVQNVKLRCEQLGIKPTVACRECGIGSSFINNIESGSAPSVVRVHALAKHLGVTISQLLGESTSADIPIHETKILDCYRSLNPEGQEKATEYIDDLVASGRYKKHSESSMGEKNA